WTEPGQVDEASERQERLVRRDVRRRLLAPDVLLARLQGEDIAALARGVYRLADDAAGHPPDEVAARSEEAVVRAAVRGEVAGRLALPERDRAAVAAGGLQHAERQRVDVRDRQCAGAVSRQPKTFGCWKMTAAASSAAARSSSASVVPARCGTSTTSRPKPGA